MKLYFVNGVRHSAVVMARTKKEAIGLAAKVSDDDRVLFGSVGDWEAPEAHELKLPNGWKIIKDL
jgi:hypothetical protein